VQKPDTAPAARPARRHAGQKRFKVLNSYNFIVFERCSQA